MTVTGSEEDAVKQSPNSVNWIGPKMNFSQHTAILKYYTYNSFWPILILFHSHLSLSEESEVPWLSIRKV